MLASVSYCSTVMLCAVFNSLSVVYFIKCFSQWLWSVEVQVQHLRLGGAADTRSGNFTYTGQSAVCVLLPSFAFFYTFILMSRNTSISCRLTVIIFSILQYKLFSFLSHWAFTVSFCKSVITKNIVKWLQQTSFYLINPF